MSKNANVSDFAEQRLMVLKLESLYHCQQVYDICQHFQIYYNLIDFPTDIIVKKGLLHINSCQTKS